MGLQIRNKQDCCGCTACQNICAHKAIEMVPDSLGFKYPKVDESKCTNCGLCEKVCAFNSGYDVHDNFKEPIPYGARHKDLKELVSSRSGGAFVALSDWILEQGGVVYGVGFMEHFKVAHKRAVTKNECKEFKGSKYVQSDLDGIFLSVRDDLRKGLKVLFSGTPCQTAGLKSFIGHKLRENLYLVDIVCHGVPSPFFWQDYLNMLEAKKGRNITSVNFRNKEKYGWTSHEETYDFGDETYHTYTYTFYKHIMFRESCGNCQYCNLKRPSDITLADFWGWEKTAPSFNLDDKGCSLVLCNTPKGLSWFNEVCDRMHVVSADLKDCMQTHLKKPSVIHPGRKDFEADYVNKGFEYVLKRYCREPFFERLRHFLGFAKRNIARNIKKLLYYKK